MHCHYDWMKISSSHFVECHVLYTYNGLLTSGHLWSFTRPIFLILYACNRQLRFPILSTIHPLYLWKYKYLFIDPSGRGPIMTKLHATRERLEISGPIFEEEKCNKIQLVHTVICLYLCIYQRNQIKSD